VVDVEVSLQGGYVKLKDVLIIRRAISEGHWAAPEDRGVTNILSSKQTLQVLLGLGEGLVPCENLTTCHYKYLHKVRSALLASASKTRKPKTQETSTNVEATLFTTNKEGTCR